MQIEVVSRELSGSEMVGSVPPNFIAVREEAWRKLRTVQDTLQQRHAIDCSAAPVATLILGVLRQEKKRRRKAWCWLKIRLDLEARGYSP